MPTRTPELDAAYRATTYRLFLPEGTVDLRLDRPDGADLWRSPSLAGRRSLAIITADNPASARLSAVENRLRRQMLRAAVVQAGWLHWSAENVPDDPAWPAEWGLCAVDQDLAAYRRLAGHFGQLAYIAAEAGQAPALRWVAAS